MAKARFSKKGYETKSDSHMKLGTDPFSPASHMVYEAKDDVQAQILSILLLCFATTQSFYRIYTLHMIGIENNTEPVSTNLGCELDDTFEHVLTVHVTVVVHVEVDHEAWVSRDEAQCLKQEFPCITLGRCDKQPGCWRGLFWILFQMRWNGCRTFSWRWRCEPINCEGQEQFLL